MLERVTITGADDGVDPAALCGMSAEFPFVEWGILLSRGRAGTPRYPSREWLRTLARTLSGSSTRLAAHLCGEYTRDALAGRREVLDELVFQRHQINGFKLPAPDFFKLASRTQTEFVLQVRSELELTPVAEFARSLPPGRASLLFDPSGGRGVEARGWPAGVGDVSVGYAGGIRPDTVERVVREIEETRRAAPSARGYWIDMESGVRTADRLDFALVREVLERTAPLLSAGYRKL